VDVAITGASGFLGSALTASLQADQVRVRPLVRSQDVAAGSRDAIYWDPTTGDIEVDKLEGVDAVVHLAGAGIADRRWTPRRKRVILTSRTEGTDLLARTLAAMDDPPQVLVSGSAVGVYGDRGDTALTEASEPGDGFLAELVQAWEEATEPAAAAGIRVTHARTGIVLSRSGGLLKPLLLPFRMGLGGRTGKGTQHMSWITRTDHVRALRFLIDTPDLSGPVNLTGPAPVTNRELTAALGRALRRPTVLPTPLLPLKLRFGSELVNELMQFSQRALPTALQRAGFTFEHQDIDTAFRPIREQMQEQIDESIQPIRESLQKHLEEALNQAFSEQKQEK
jgi:uncharacterized protein